MFNKLMRAMYWKTSTGKWDKREIQTDLFFITIGIACIAIVVAYA